MKHFTLYSHLAVFLFCLSIQNKSYTQSQQYLHFDRQNDFVEVPDASKYIANGSGLSLTGWFYCDELAYGQGMFGFRNGGTGDGEMYMIQLSNGVLENRYITTGGFSEYVTPAFTVLPETWQHYAWVWDGSQVHLYLNGDLLGSAAASGVPITSTDTPFAIGQLISPFNFFYGGRIDEVSMWSKAITSEEIKDMMENELVGDEENLELYYKFNQGVPGADNSSISFLKCEVGDGERDGILKNFTLNGESSNFGGELDNSFQAISFPLIGDKLITDAPFELEAEASSGLEVVYTIVSGPASVLGNTVTLDGTVGEVVVRAGQPGEGTFEAAEDVEVSFHVLDPETFLPSSQDRAPVVASIVVAPSLTPIQLATISEIGSPELFNVQEVNFEIDGEVVPAKDWGNNHYTAWWTPPAYGQYTMNIVSTNNYGFSSTTPVDFEVVETNEDVSSSVATDIHLDVNVGSETVTAVLPSHIGAYDRIVANLDIGCPTGGCDPWDRVSGVEMKGHDGVWREVIRYITPYGLACNHAVDLTDFMSLLHGRVDFRFYLGTQGNGFLYTLNLDYRAGIPDYAYSQVTDMWNASYNFGNLDNLQPYPSKVVSFDENAETSILKLVATGHGWGENNTGNAAEFHEDTHHVMVDGEEAHAHNNWLDCDPNPDGCNNQFGTWYFDRAGWCPGAIAPWNDFDLTEYMEQGEIALKYRLNENYIDYCNASNPNCVSGVTCTNCNDGFNPHLITASYVISKGNQPLGNSSVVGVDDLGNQIAFKVFPNPAEDQLHISFDSKSNVSKIEILNSFGQVVESFDQSIGSLGRSISLEGYQNGAYFVKVFSETHEGVERIVVLR